MNYENYCSYLMSLRQRVIKKDGPKNLKLLLANFSKSEQKKDIEIRTPVIDDFFRIKINVKAFNSIDFSDTEAVFDSLRNEFDIPYWAFHKLKKGLLSDYNNTFIYQIKACNLHCPYCFVDDFNKNPKQEKQDSSAGWFSISEILDVFEKENAKQIVHNFRPSGGEPTLAPGQWLLALEEISKRNLQNVFVQGDTNLTTGHFIEHLEQQKTIQKNILEKVAEYENFGLLCSFKGTDSQGFSENTGARPELFEEQFYSFKKIIKAGIDAYPFLYNPNPKTLEQFMEKGAKMFGEGFYFKTWIFKLKLYGPEKERLAKIGKNPEKYQKELDENFVKSKEVMQDIIWKKFHLNYQAIPRTGIELKVEN